MRIEKQRRQRLCLESSTAAKEGDAEPTRAHAGPRRGSQVLCRAPEGPTQLRQRLPELTQGLLGLTQAKKR